MRRRCHAIPCLVLLGIFQRSCLHAQSAAAPTPQAATTHKSHENELDTILMQSTFKLQSIGMPGQPPTLGVVFIMGRLLSNIPAGGAAIGRYVLITAAHVLEEMPSDVATLSLRRKNSEGDW